MVASPIRFRTQSSTASRRGQVPQQRHRLGGELRDLGVPLLVRPQQVRHDMAHAGGMEFADAFGNLLGAAERAIAHSRLAEIHRIANAERLRRAIQCLFIGVVDAGEQQVAGAELSQVAARPARGVGDLRPARRDTCRG